MSAHDVDMAEPKESDEPTIQEVPLSGGAPTPTQGEDVDRKSEPGVSVKKEEGDHPMGQDEDADDPVVHSYDLHLSNRLFQHLHLFQFPCRPADRPYNFEQLSSMKMQVKSNRFELAFNPRQKSMQFGEQGQDEEAAPHQKPYVLSSTKIRNKTNYAIGVVRHGNMHITGLPNMHQFRPNLEKTVAANSVQQNLPETGNSVQEDEKLTKQEQVRVEAMQKHYEGRLRSYALGQQKSDSWVSMGLSTAGNPESKRGILERLFSSSSQVVPMNPRHTTKLYLSQLFKSVHERWLHEPHAKIPASMMSEFDWKKQVDSVILSAKVLRFEKLKSFMRPHKNTPLPDDAEIVAYVTQCCVIIHGMLIVKTTPDLSPSSKVAREWILYNLWKTPRLKRASLTCDAYKFEVGPLWMKQILEDVAEFQMSPNIEDRVWTLRNGGSDPDFAAKFPQIIADENKLWETRATVIERNVFGRLTPGSAIKELAFPWRAQPVMMNAPSISERVKEKAVIERWIQLIFKKRPIWNKQVLDTKFREFQLQYAKKMSLPDDIYVKMLTLNTRQFNDGLILSRLGASPEVEQYRDTVVGLFIKRQSWPRAEFETEVEHIPRSHLSAVLQELTVTNGNVISASPPSRG